MKTGTIGPNTLHTELEKSATTVTGVLNIGQLTWDELNKWLVPFFLCYHSDQWIEEKLQVERCMEGARKERACPPAGSGDGVRTILTGRRRRRRRRRRTLSIICND